MRIRRRQRVGAGGDNAEVALSPLIDCVFLLLIFFLVTSILKRKEKQIQVDLPDSTASVSAATVEDIIVIGIDEIGNTLIPASAKDKDGGYQWQRLPDLAAHLQQLVNTQGIEVLNRPLQINAHRETPFQKAIDAIDLCKLQGFTRVSVKTRQLIAGEQ